jgi:hypothetical protein
MEIVFVIHPDPKNDDKDISWGVCRSCGTMEPVSDTGLDKDDDHNDAQESKWEISHVCKENPEYFALSEYGNMGEYYGLDVDSL